VGTNYYLSIQPACPACGRSFERLHIGKSSAGWCFSLHVIPEQHINTLEDWIALWSKPEAFICDEYDTEISGAEMEAIITERRSLTNLNERIWPSFYRDEQDFHTCNDSERGPNNLIRARISATCIGHGDGTYDCIVGDFS
jgi:hypothetical protein